MKKLFKRLLNNKGLTLTELIVALFLTSVILAIAVGMLTPVKDLMNTMKSNAHMDTISSTVDEYVRGTLQAATSLKFVQLNNRNEVANEDRNSVMDFCTPANKAKAIAILNTNSDSTGAPIYRLFDLGDLAQDWTLLNKHLGYACSGLLADAAAVKKYAAFNEPFYGGESISCAVEFYSNGTFLQVASQCFKDNGKKDDDDNPIMDMINQKHVLNFMLLNSAVPTDAGGEETFSDPDTQTEIEGHCYLILYTLYDWDSL